MCLSGYVSFRVHSGASDSCAVRLIIAAIEKTIYECYYEFAVFPRSEGQSEAPELNFFCGCCLHKQQGVFIHECGYVSVVTYKG